jgi:hypothetical protein
MSCPCPLWQGGIFITSCTDEHACHTMHIFGLCRGNSKVYAVLSVHYGGTKSCQQLSVFGMHSHSGVKSSILQESGHVDGIRFHA